MDERLVWDDDMQMWHLGTTETHRWDLLPLIFTTAITCAKLSDGPDWKWYDDRWCYKDVASAVNAFLDWDATTYIPGVCEPEGWHRHPPTGRRRKDGDPATEEIRH